jgi:hypothetical protein
MRDLQDILANVEPMSIKELEAHIMERRRAMDDLRNENRKLTPYRDRKWAEHFRQTAGPPSLARVLDLGKVN